MGDRLKQLFLKRLSPEPNTGGWLWTGDGKEDGYGRMKFNGEMVYAHRLAFELFKGPLDGRQALHRCDNRACVNPDHLFSGTNTENRQDMVDKNRQARGERHPNARLSNDQVVHIKTLLGTGVLKQKTIAALFGVSHKTVSNIQTGDRRAVA